MNLIQALFTVNRFLMFMNIMCTLFRIAFECEKYVVSFDQYMQALKFIEKTYGPESKEMISVYHALAHVSVSFDINNSLVLIKSQFI